MEYKSASVTVQTKCIIFSGTASDAKRQKLARGSCLADYHTVAPF